MLNVIESSFVHANTKAKVRAPELRETTEFIINSEALQSDTLAPVLFITVLDHAVWQATSGIENMSGLSLTPKRSTKVNSNVITAFAFVDGT